MPEWQPEPTCVWKLVLVEIVRLRSRAAGNLLVLRMLAGKLSSFTIRGRLFQKLQRLRLQPESYGQQKSTEDLKLKRRGTRAVGSGQHPMATCCGREAPWSDMTMKKTQLLCFSKAMLLPCRVLGAHLCPFDTRSVRLAEQMVRAQPTSPPTAARAQARLCLR